MLAGDAPRHRGIRGCCNGGPGPRRTVWVGMGGAHRAGPPCRCLVSTSRKAAVQPGNKKTWSPKYSFKAHPFVVPSCWRTKS